MPISMTDQLSPLDATEERAWRALAYFFVTVPRFLDEDLQRGARMSVSAYTILVHLSEAPERTLRVTELASRSYVSGSRTTRLVDELVAAGYATRQRCTTDGRGFDIGLTGNGLTALEHAYPIHLRSVRTRVLDHVDQSAMSCFAEVVTSIASALEWRGLPRPDRGSCQSDPASERGRAHEGASMPDDYTRRWRPDSTRTVTGRPQ